MLADGTSHSRITMYANVVGYTGSMPSATVTTDVIPTLCIQRRLRADIWHLQTNNTTDAQKTVV